MLFACVLFGTGAILMALEMVGSRLLAPTFGNSIFVWGALIGTVLLALSLGAWLGGRIADRHPSPRALAALLLAAAALIALLPEWSGRVNAALAGAPLGPRLTPLAAALALFAVPGTLLGTAAPFLLRLSAQGLEGLGGLAGRLSAVGSLGSIAGTLGAAFLLIPALPVSALLRLLGLVQAGLGLLLLAAPPAPASSNRSPVRSAGRPPRWGPSLLWIAWIAGAAWFAGALAAGEGPEPGGGGPPALGASEEPGPRVLEARDSVYHHIRVVQEGGIRYLRFDRSLQSGLDLRNPDRAVFAYTDYLHLPVLFHPPGEVLMIGLGGGTVARKYLDRYPDVRFTAVEIDPVVVEVARRWFHLPEDPRLAIEVEDGRRFLRARPAARYDLILLDAYFADAIPFHLTTREFLEEVADRLAPGGVVAANLIGALEGPRSELLASFARTFAAVFPQVYLFPVGGRPTAAWQNVILVATRSEERLTAEVLRRRGEEWAARSGVEALGSYAAGLRPGPPAGGRLLTDDFAPVDRLLHLDGEGP